MKKQNKKSGTGSGIFVIIVGVLFILGMGAFIIASSDYLFHGAKSLDEMLENNGAPVKGEYVTVDVDAVIDWYAETQYKINGIIPAGKKQHAVIWLNNDAMMGITVKGKKDVAKIDGLIEGTWKWLMGNSENLPASVTIEGKITNIGTEVSKYYGDAKGYVKDLLGDYEFYDLEIDATDNKKSIILYCAIAFVIGVICIVSGASIIRTAKKEKANSQVQGTYVVQDDMLDNITSQDDQNTNI